MNTTLATRTLYNTAIELVEGLAREIRNAESKGRIQWSFTFVDARLATIREVLNAIDKLESD